MKIGFIGTGNMGGAILKGYVKSENSAGNEILIHNRTTEHNNDMAKAISANAEGRVKVCNDNLQLAREADIIMIGVKPNGVDEVLREIASVIDDANHGFGAEDKIIVSMAAGVSLSSMEESLSRGKAGCGAFAKLVRIMPNTPALVGEAMTSMSRNSKVTDSDFALVKSVIDAVGISEEVDEDMIDCVIGVSGSSPAYTYMYIQALAEGARANGMSPEKARVFAAQAVLGAAKMVLESKESLDRLRINVCSPGGTTIEAVEALQANGFADDVKEGMQAAIDKSRSMTK